MDSIKELQAFLVESGLPLPPLPKSLVAQLQRQGEESYFTSRPQVPSPWNTRWYLDELMSQEVPDYGVVGLAGHGIESVAMHYYLVHQDIALFHQSSLNSVYGQPQQVERVEHQYDLAATLFIAAEDAKQQGHIPASGRVVMVNSVFARPMWGIQSVRGEPVMEWHQTEDALLSVADWIANRQGL